MIEKSGTKISQPFLQTDFTEDYQEDKDVTVSKCELFSFESKSLDVMVALQWLVAIGPHQFVLSPEIILFLKQV